MLPTQNGSFRLFRIAGIVVFVHWWWFLAAAFEIQRTRIDPTGIYGYTSPVWVAVEYLALFFIVLLHEFGHALACRSTGGFADRIVLWPLGGVAYVSPPDRPGAVLWSIAAGPLVNVALIPVIAAASFVIVHAGWLEDAPNAYRLLRMVGLINLMLLVFNILPIYPLDGGQILQSLLWFPLGKRRSLKIASGIGVGCGIALGLWALSGLRWWLMIMAYFLVTRAVAGWRYANALAAQTTTIPRRPDAVCPSCRVEAPVGNFWACDQCGTAFDTFATGGQCPKCGHQFATTRCPACHATSPFTQWQVAEAKVVER